MIKFSGKLYDVLKSIGQVWLPAAGTLYFALAGIWGFPDPNQVVGSITALDTFLGVVLAVSSAGYVAPSDGTIVVDKSAPTKDRFLLQLGTPVEDIGNKSSLVFNVVKDDLPPKT